MVSRHTAKSESAKLRRRAEERVAMRGRTAATHSGADLHRLIHELRVHQIELELQNEELRQVGGQLEASITERKLTEARLRQSERNLRVLATNLQSAREGELIRIAREIHDGLGQALTGLKMDLTWLMSRLHADQEPLLNKAKSMSGLIDDTIRSIRKIASGLRPEVLDEAGLASAIAWQARNFQLRSGIRCALSLPPDRLDVDPARSIAVFRIFQELLTNVARHANASKVDVLMRTDKDVLVFEVRDDGRGITDAQIRDSKSLGLLGMRERVFPFDGKIEIKGISGQGTQVTVLIPFDSSQVTATTRTPS